jgi:hypothetical protein
MCLPVGQQLSTFNAVDRRGSDKTQYTFSFIPVKIIDFAFTLVLSDEERIHAEKRWWAVQDSNL